jgi:peptidoglycan/xylan/chitin deacetylase (PgdA/CDA1 family)
MIEVNPLKRATAAVMDRIGVTSLSFAVQRWTLSPFIRVVYYHDVPPALADRFERQLEFLKRSFVPASKADLDRLLTQGVWSHDRPGIIVTFDDGLRSHYEVVAPILDRLGFQGWFFVPVDLVTMPSAEQPAATVRHGVFHDCDTTRDPRVFMSETQVMALSKRHVVGCHTASHVRLSRELSDSQLHIELDNAKRRLEAIVDRNVDAFSWVGGEEWAYSENAARIVANLFKYAFTTNTCVARRGASRLNIDRAHVEASFEPSLVRLHLSGMMDLYYRPKRKRLESRLLACRSPAAA